MMGNNFISLILNSFDILHDSLGFLRSEFPHTVYCVAGTQVSSFGSSIQS